MSGDPPDRRGLIHTEHDTVFVSSIPPGSVRWRRFFPFFSFVEDKPSMLNFQNNRQSGTPHTNAAEIIIFCSICCNVATEATHGSPRHGDICIVMVVSQAGRYWLHPDVQSLPSHGLAGAPKIGN